MFKDGLASLAGQPVKLKLRDVCAPLAKVVVQPFCENQTQAPQRARENETKGGRYRACWQTLAITIGLRQEQRMPRLCTSKANAGDLTNFAACRVQRRRKQWTACERLETWNAKHLAGCAACPRGNVTITESSAA